jgi:hypothetical protein
MTYMLFVNGPKPLTTNLPVTKACGFAREVVARADGPPGRMAAPSADAGACAVIWDFNPRRQGSAGLSHQIAS